MTPSDFSEDAKRNLARVDNLIRVYDLQRPPGKGRPPQGSSDLLRSGVVFLHATLEDFLRNLIRWHWPEYGAEETINGVPLAGSGGGRPAKFFLGKLTQHRGKMVDDLLAESVEAYLERSNFNDTVEVVGVLESVGIEATIVGGQLPAIAKLMERRHQIVHRADRNPNRGRGHHRAAPISSDKVRGWRKSVKEFIDAVVAAA